MKIGRQGTLKKKPLQNKAKLCIDFAGGAKQLGRLQPPQIFSIITEKLEFSLVKSPHKLFR